ncbi:hypothetical protein CQA62_06750, partial [Helicobacter cholecystus]
MGMQVFSNITAASENGRTANNTISFTSTGTNTIQGNISATPFEASGVVKNTITFSAGTNIITGNIDANWNGSGNASNSITVSNSQSFTLTGKTYSGDGTTNTFDLQTGVNTIQNAGEDAFYANNGTNTVTFAGDKDATIIGNLHAERANASNQITFNSSALNVFQGDIRNDSGGTNQINVTNGEGNLKIGSISNNSGTNTISVTKGNITINGNVSGSSNSAS